MRKIYKKWFLACLIVCTAMTTTYAQRLAFNNSLETGSNPDGPIVVGQKITLQVVAVIDASWVRNISISLTGDGLAGELMKTTGEGVIQERAVMKVYFTTPGYKTVTATASDYNSATYTVMVNKGDPTDVDFTIPTGHIYNGLPQGIGSITQTENGITGFGTVTVYYNGSQTAPTNAGTYTVTADFAGGDNFDAATGVPLGDYTIDPKDITVTALGGSSTYGDSPINPGFTADGLVNNEMVSVLTGLSNDFNVTPTTPAGSYTLNVTGDLTNDNYNITQRNTGTWIVNQAPTFFTVNMTADEGIILLPSPGIHAVTEGGSFTFYITLAEGYEGRTPQVTVNGEPARIQLRPNGYEWVYSIPWVYENTNVVVSFASTGNEIPGGSYIYSRDGRLFIEADTSADLTVYSVTGQVLTNRRLTEGLTGIPLPNGVYIVKLDKVVQKVSILR